MSSDFPPHLLFLIFIPLSGKLWIDKHPGGMGHGVPGILLWAPLTLEPWSWLSGSAALQVCLLTPWDSARLPFPSCLCLLCCKLANTPVGKGIWGGLTWHCLLPLGSHALESSCLDWFPVSSSRYFFPFSFYSCPSWQDQYATSYLLIIGNANVFISLSVSLKSFWVFPWKPALLQGMTRLGMLRGRTGWICVGFGIWKGVISVFLWIS